MGVIHHDFSGEIYLRPRHRATSKDIALRLSLRFTPDYTQIKKRIYFFKGFLDQFSTTERNATQHSNTRKIDRI